MGSKALSSLPLAVPLLSFPKMLAWLLPLVLPRIFAVPLVLLLRPLQPPPKIFDAPPLLLLPNILGAPLLALLAKMFMVFPKILVELPLLLADLAGSLPVVLPKLLPNDDPLYIKILAFPPLLPPPKRFVGLLLLSKMPAAPMLLPPLFPIVFEDPLVLVLPKMLAGSLLLQLLKMFAAPLFLPLMLLLLLPELFAVLLVLLLKPLLPLPKIFDAPPLLLLPKMPLLLPRMFEDTLVLKLLFPKMLLLPPVLLVPKTLVGTLLFSLLKMLTVPFLP